MIHAMPLRHFNRAIFAAVVNQQPFNGVKPLDLTRQVFQRDGKGVFLVITGNLDNQFHGLRSFRLGRKMIHFRNFVDILKPFLHKDVV